MSQFTLISLTALTTFPRVEAFSIFIHENVQFIQVDVRKDWADNELAGSAPFIPAEIYSLFRDLEIKCKQQLGDFVDFRLRPDSEEYIAECKDEYKEVWKRTRQIQSDLDAIIDKLREYLAQLEVV